MGLERRKARGAAPVAAPVDDTTPVAATGTLTFGDDWMGQFGDGVTIGDGAKSVTLTWANIPGSQFNGTQVDTIGRGKLESAANLAAALDAQGLDLTVTDNADGSVSLEHTIPGSHGNVAITVNNGSGSTGFAASGMSGGAGTATSLTAVTGLRRSRNLADLSDAEAARVALDVGYGAGAQTAHGFVAGEVIRGNFGSWEKATADSASNAAGIVGIVVEVPDADTFRWAEAGQEFDLSGADEGSLHWLDTALAGALSPTEPTSPGQVKKLMAIGVGEGRAVVVNGPAIPVQSVAVQAAATLYRGTTAPAAASATAVLAGWSANDAGTMHNGVGVSNPDVPRNLTCTFPADWDGGDITVPIYDQYGLLDSEVFVASGNLGTTVVGTKVCASLAGNISKGAVGAVASQVTVGTGNKLGLYFSTSGGAGEALVNDAAVAWSSAPALIDATIDTLRDAYTPSVAPDGALTYRLLLNVYHRHNLT